MEQINYRYIISLTATISIGFFVQGYCFGCFNSLTMILHAQYVNKGYYVMKDEEWFNSIVSSLVPIGAIIGAPLGGPLASIGRRYAILITSLVFTLGCILTLIFNFYCLLIGRFVIGLCVGAYTSISPMFISEIAPKSISGPLGISNQLMAMIGITISYFVGFKVPVQDDESALTTGIWRLIFLLPGVITFIQFLLMLFVFTYDSPYYYESQRDKINYRATITKIYRDRKPSTEEVLNGSDQEHLINNDDPLEEESNKPKDITWGELVRPPYQKALSMGVFLSILHQATGISFIIFYSNEIFTVGSEGADAERAARWGTFLVGIFGVVGSVLGIMLSSDFGRRNVTLFGFLAMGVIHGILFAVAKDEAYSHLVSYLIIAFSFFFNATFGSILWIYCSEILRAKGVSIVAQVNMIGVLCFGSMANVIFKYLHPYGMFFTFGIFQFISFLFVYNNLLETKGLSLEESQSIYFPKVSKKKTIELSKSPSQK